jgi:hypothetical protein
MNKKINSNLICAGFITPQRLNMEHSLLDLYCQISFINKRFFSSNLSKSWVYPWIVGVTDGDGTFSIHYQNNKWSLNFSIAQSCYNLRLLYFIKNYLNLGSISIDNNNMAKFRIRDRKILLNYIIPIFDSYPLLTTKYFNYDKFKQVLFILENSNLTKSEKDQLIFNIIKSKPPIDYISPVWLNNNFILSKPWIIGFIEAEGSFYIVNKNNNPPRLSLGFGISQKLDKIVLNNISKLINIETQIQYKEKHNYYILDTTKNSNILNIINYIDNQMIGMKSVEFKIWKESLLYKGNYDKLKIYQDRLRQLKTIKPNLDLFQLTNK